MLPPGANCCWPPASCSPGPICRRRRAPKAAIRGLLVIVLRGALDGLAAVAPVGDRHWEALRGDKILRRDGPTPGLPLDDFFVLNPAMPNLHRLYGAGEAAIVHAVASPYRERSHFDGQDVLESGLVAPGTSDSGWLNRALGTLAPGERVEPGNRKAFAIGPVTPLVARGPAPVLSWTPPRLEPAADDTVMRLLDLYRHSDAPLARALEERIGLAAIARAGGMETGPGKTPAAGAAQVRAYFAEFGGECREVHGASRRPARRRACL